MAAFFPPGGGLWGLEDEASVARLRDKIFHYQRRVKEESLNDPVHRLDDPRQYDSVELEKLAGVARRLLGSTAIATGFLTEVAHEIIWSQCFSDGNHRTAVASVLGLAGDLGFGVPKEKFFASTSRFIDRSHTYTDLNRWPYTPAQQANYKQKQRALVEEWVAENVGHQVGSLATIGSHSLKILSSRAEK